MTHEKSQTITSPDEKKKLMAGSKVSTFHHKRRHFCWAIVVLAHEYNLIQQPWRWTHLPDFSYRLYCKEKEITGWHICKLIVGQKQVHT